MFKTIPRKKAIDKAIEDTAPRRGVHIDRIRVTGPLNHRPLGEVFYKAVDDERVVPVGSQAVKPNAKKNPEDVYIRSKEIQQNGMANMLEIDCCPPKILQGHNFFGHDNLLDYVYALFCKQVEKFALEVDEDILEQWRTGQVAITLIHFTANFWCPEGTQEAIVQAIDENNSMGKHRDVSTCITLGYVSGGMRSKNHMLTIYSKADVLEKEWKKLGKYQTRILVAAKKSIRLEIKCFSQWLKKNDLGYVMRWKDVDLDSVFFKLLAVYQINNSIQRLITNEEKDMLTRAQLRAYTLWLNGDSPAKHYGRTTVWKYANAIMKKTGIDIRAHRRPDPIPALDIRKILVKENIVPNPKWANEVPERYWQPGRAFTEYNLRWVKFQKSQKKTENDGVISSRRFEQYDTDLDQLAY
jgi:hypothetical protein